MAQNPKDRPIQERVALLEAGHQDHGKILKKLLKSDKKRTGREKMLALFVTRIIPAGIAVATAAFSALSWYVSHIK